MCPFATRPPESKEINSPKACTAQVATDVQKHDESDIEYISPRDTPKERVKGAPSHRLPRQTHKIGERNPPNLPSFLATRSAPTNFLSSQAASRQLQQRSGQPLHGRPALISSKKQRKRAWTRKCFFVLQSNKWRHWPPATPIRLSQQPANAV